MPRSRGGQRPLGARALQWIVIVVGLLATWEVIAVALSGRGSVVPSPQAVVTNIVNSWSVFASALGVTVGEALWGFVFGNIIAIALGGISIISRRTESIVHQLGVLSYCLPIVAIGPILVIALSGHLPEEVLAGMAVVFTSMVLTAEGLEDVPKALHELAGVYGASDRRFLVLIRIKFALPYVFRGLRIAAPAALLGAIIGEFLGAGSGIGVVMVQAEQGLQVARTWAAAGLSTAVAGAAYAVVGLVERVLLPWTREVGL